MTKKERRKIAQELEFGQRIEKKKRVRNVNLEEYLRRRNEKPSQLNPVVMDNRASFPAGKGQDYNEEDALKRREDVNYSGNTRVEPRNPRWAVYGRGLDDITEFFNSGITSAVTINQEVFPPPPAFFLLIVLVFLISCSTIFSAAEDKLFFSFKCFFVDDGGPIYSKDGYCFLT